MEILLNFLAVLGIVIFSGFGIGYFILPKDLRRFALLLSPFMGSGVLIFLSQFFNSCHLPIAHSYLYTVALIVAFNVFFVFALLKNKTPLSQEWLGFIPSLFACAVVLWPLFDIGYLTFWGGGTDSLGYIRVAHFLMHRTIPYDLTMPQTAYPWEGWVYFVSRETHGNIFLLGTLSQMLSKDPYQVFNLQMSLHAFMLPVSVYFICRACFQFSKVTSLLASSLMASQNFWMVAAYTTFLNQTAGVPYIILLFGLIFLFFGFGLKKMNLKTAPHRSQTSPSISRVPSTSPPSTSCGLK